MTFWGVVFAIIVAKAIYEAIGVALDFAVAAWSSWR